jgi:membrane-associated phospholipid phosphatase
MKAGSLSFSAALVALILFYGPAVGETLALAASGQVLAHEDVNRGSAQTQAFDFTTDRQDLISMRSLSIVLAGGAATWLALKGENQNFLRRYLDQSTFDIGCDAGDTYGTGIPQGVGILGLMAMGHLGGHSDLTDAGKDLSVSLMTTGAVVWALKIGIDRKRPNGGKYSFPSGHIAVAFSTVPVVSHHFGWKAGVMASTLAGFTALGRMEENRHYLSDVVFGASIGLAVGYAAVARREFPGGLGFLSIGPDHAGITFRF